MKSVNKRKLLKPADIFIIIILSVVSLAVLFSFNSKNSEKLTALISVDGKVTDKIDLTNSEDKIFTLNTEPTVTLEIKNHQIRFINAKCPDKTCEKSGFLKKNGDTAACVPAKTVVTVVGEESQDIDIVVG